MMGKELRILKINPVYPENYIIQFATSLIHKGCLIVCPTDTCYILAANALDASAVNKVYQIKGRPHEKAIHVIVDSIDAAEKIAIVNEAALKLAKRFLPGPLTIVLQKRDINLTLAVGTSETIGIRIPNNPIALSLANLTRVPLTATSANISGAPSPYNVDDIMEQFTDQRLGLIALILDQGPLPITKPSTIVDLSQIPAKILREGPVPSSAIFNCLAA